MKEFDGFMDLTGKDRELKCQYHGTKDPQLEARLFENDSGTGVSVSLREEDIASHNYDSKRNSLDIWYQAPSPETIRIALLTFQGFSVPDTIQEINVYDVGQEIEQK